MTNTDDGSKILKTDALGRVRTPAARHEQLLDEFERSGVSGAKFAGLTGLKYQTFASWVQRRRRGPTARANTPGDPASTVRWLEAVVGTVADNQKDRPCHCICRVERVWRFPALLKSRWRRLCCGPWKRPERAEFCGQPEGVCGAGGVRHAQRVQWAARAGDGEAG